MKPFLLLALLTLLGCQSAPADPVTRYREAVKAGLEAPASEVPAVLSIDLGIPAREFFDRCTTLNQQQLITMGRGGNVVDHAMPNELSRPATMTFRPVFIGQPRQLQALELRFMYEDWAPWNQAASADSLLPEVANYFHQTLDTELIDLRHPRHGRVFASVEANRLLTLWAEDQSTVKGMVTDLSTLTGDPLELLQ